jgi:hypothetical protein
MQGSINTLVLHVDDASSADIELLDGSKGWSVQNHIQEFVRSSTK